MVKQTPRTYEVAAPGVNARIVVTPLIGDSTILFEDVLKLRLAGWEVTEVIESPPPVLTQEGAE
jgi:hypothetical protein